MYLFVLLLLTMAGIYTLGHFRSFAGTVSKEDHQRAMLHYYLCSVQNLTIIRKLMFYQAVVCRSFINKISQIGEY